MIYDDPRLDEFKRIFAASGSVDTAWEKVFGPTRDHRFTEMLKDLEAAKGELERLNLRVEERRGEFLHLCTTLRTLRQDLGIADEAAMDLLRTPLE